MLYWTKMAVQQIIVIHCFIHIITGHLVGYVNASVANSNQEITYETSTIANDVITIENTTGALYVNGTIDADIPVCCFSFLF